MICWVCVLALPVTLPGTLWLWPEQPVAVSAWVGFVYVGVFSMWVGFFAWYRGLAMGGALRVSQTQLLQPFLSILAAVPLLGEPLDIVTLGFAGAVVATVVAGKKLSQAAHASRSRDGIPITTSHIQGNDMNWKLAARAEKMNPSVIREILKVTERPGIISLAGGLPSPKTFPISAFAEACAEVLHKDGQAALQYAASEGYGPLREAVAAMLPWPVDPAQVLITTGSQQGLDLIAKVLLDPGSRVLVETPTYLGALQAFAPMEPEPVSVASDDEGVIVDDLVAKAKDARFVYLLPNFQNPTGRTMTEERRAAVSAAAAEGRACRSSRTTPTANSGSTKPPPLPLTARNPEGCIYLGSFSKVLAPGLRLGFLVAPKAIYPKLLQAKQAADLHTPELQPAHGVRGDEGRLPRPPRAHHPRALQAPARRHAGGARARDERPGRASSTSRRAACSCGCACPRAWTRSRCCRRRWSAAWPSCRARRSMPAPAIRARCACPS